ncbi:MAG: efflux RND transporter periplasmic adaptor subunit, partial [Selenomonadaceae bacterium]|nr:efflux RND transporter periplasmic adaptor subunit [Selenomonadaceae bacterium]
YEAKMNKAQYEVTNTRSKYSRISYLYSIGAKSQEELEDAKFNYDTAQSNLVSAESDVNNTIITAPMDGVVVGIPQTVGSMAVQGNNSPTVIMRIADLSSKQILAKVDETDIGSVKVGQEATFTVDSYSGKTFRARVSKISQTDTGNTWNINSSSSTSSTSANSSASVIYYYVTLDVEDPENLLLPAMTARVDITTASRSEVLSVPLSTLKTDSNGSYVVLVQPDGTQENRYVETGIYDDEYVEILSGLEEGDMISSSYTAKKSSSSGSSKNDRGGPPPHM